MVWADNVAVQARAAQPAEGRRGEARLSAAASEELRSFVDWVANYTLAPARHGAAHGPAHGRAWPGARARRGAACRPAAAAPDAGAPPRARRAGRRFAAHQARGRQGCRRLGRRHRRPRRRRHAGSRSRCRPSRSRASPIPDYREPELTGPQRMAADILRGAVAQGGFTVDLLDGVTGSGKTEVYFEAIAETIRRRPPVAGPDAGDRAHGAIPRPLRGSASACARPNGIRSSAAQARAHLERGRGRRGQCRGRRALGAVSPLRRSRPDRGR